MVRIIANKNPIINFNGRIFISLYEMSKLQYVKINCNTNEKGNLHKEAK